MLPFGLRFALTASVVTAVSERQESDEFLRRHLDHIAAHVQADDWEGARAIVGNIAASQRLASSATWRSLQWKIGLAAACADTDPNQKRYRAEIASDLGLYDLALELGEARLGLVQSESDLRDAQMDLAETARKAGLNAVRRRDYLRAQRHYETVVEYGVSWVKELGKEKAELVAAFARDPDSVAARIKFAKRFWIRQHSVESDSSAAVALLTETLASSRPIPDADRKEIYMLLAGFSGADQAAARSWEDRILAEFAEDIDLIADIYVARAQRAYAEKDLGLALQHYRHVCESLSGSSAYGVARFNGGIILKEQRRYAEAIAEFEKLLISQVNDQDPSGNLMAPYRNYRPRAQWEIGESYRALGRYRDAPQAYVDTEKKYPFQSWCGNAHAEFAYRYALYKGLCHEHLGQHYAAAVIYWWEVADGSGFYHSPTIHLRLLDLYEATGQVDALRGLLDDVDDRRRKQISKHMHQPVDEETLEKLRPSATIRELMRIRGVGQNRQWNEMIASCRAKGTVAGPEENYARLGNWQAVEAANALARVPSETVPLLIEAARTTRDPDVKWLYFALGRCSTDQSLDFLIERAGTEDNIWPLQTIVFSLSLAGKPGYQRLERLALTAEYNLASAIRAWQEGRFAAGNEVDFPPWPQTANLPQRLGEIAVARAIGSLTVREAGE